MNRWTHERMVEDQELEERYRRARAETASHATLATAEALGGADRRGAAAQASDLERLMRNAQASIVILERRLHAATGALRRMRDAEADCRQNGAHGHAAVIRDHADDLARALEAT